MSKKRHILALLVDNEAGTLSRVIGIFTGRGYNIESVTVSEVDEARNLSRITVVTSGSEKMIAQIKALLERIIPVHMVADITLEGAHVERELALIKVAFDSEKKKEEILHLAGQYTKVREADATDSSFVFEHADIPAKIDEFLERMAPLGIVEVARTGITALVRGAKTIEG